MVVSMKWRPWLPLQSKKFDVRIMVQSIKGLQVIDDDDEKFKGVDFDRLSKLKVEIKWKGSKNIGFRPLKKKTVKKDFSKEVGLSQNGVVLLDDEFKRVCEFCWSKYDMMGDFHPWEVVFLVFYNSKKQTNKMAPLAAPAVLNLSEFASLGDVTEAAINIPLSIINSSFNCSPSLCISLSLVEVKATQELSVEVPRQIMFAPLSPCFGASPLIKKDEASGFKSSLRKVKSLTDFVSSRHTKGKAYQGEGSSDSKFSTGSEGSEYNSPFDTDSFDDTDEAESETKEDSDALNFCNYGTLVHANLAGGAHVVKINCEGDDLFYYSKHKPHSDSSPTEDFGPSVSEQVLKQSPKFGFSWTKGKLSFKSRRVKGEPLLKKNCSEEGGDDIDFYRRQLSSDESLMQLEGSVGSESLISEFGDDYFAVGNWEQKEIMSRDGSLRLQTQIFFASIDQRSERAAGESACTALVAVMADWLHSNQGEMPVKSEFDCLIREGSLQWRNLCDNEYHREKFPDKHFDLETVIQAHIRPLSVIPERSFIGFFHPDGLDECFGFLHGAMSFDSIWDEISRVASELNCNSEPLVYVVSWNDHFFILRVDWDAYYIIDTLGERLFEGCNQAYVLKFNSDTTIEKLPCQTPPKDEKTTQKTSPTAEASSSSKEQETSIDGQELEEEKVICRGKECCKEYIKSFLAAIPIRELQIDMKKGIISSVPLHHRLQIEFNYTTKQQFFPAPVEHIASEIAGVMTATDVQASATVAPIMAADLQAPMSADVPASIMVADLQAPTAADARAPIMVADLQAPRVADVPASMMTVAVA
ncbi:Glucosamine-6-phosphate deaminase [Bienertia sinuspersici]